MDTALNSSSLVPPRRLGSALQSTRQERGVSVEYLANASAQQFSATDLLDIEAGRRRLSDDDFKAVLALYQFENRPVFPPRVKLVIDTEYSTISAGSAAMPLSMTERGHVLDRYVALLYILREEPAGSKLKLRSADVEVLAEAFRLDPDEIRDEVVAIMGGDSTAGTTASLTERFLVPTVGVLVGVVSVGAIVMVPAAKASAEPSVASGPIPEFVESDSVRSSSLAGDPSFTESDGGAEFWVGAFGADTPAAPLGEIDGSGSTGTSVDDPLVMTDVAVDEGDPIADGGQGSFDNPMITDVIVDEEDGDGGGQTGIGSDGIEDSGEGLVPNDGGAGSGVVGDGGTGIEDSGEGLVPNDGGAGSGVVGDGGTGIEDSGEGLVPNDGGAGSGVVGDGGTGIEDSGEGLVPNDGGAGSGDIGIEPSFQTGGADTSLAAFFGGDAAAKPARADSSPDTRRLAQSSDDDPLASGIDVTAENIEVLDETVSVLSLAGGADYGLEEMGGGAQSDVGDLAAEAQSLITFDWQWLLPDWTVSFVADGGSVRGETSVPDKTIVVRVSGTASAQTVASVLAHEIGTALDVTYLGDEQRAEWLATRGLDGAWWPESGESDLGSGAGDFAEAFAVILSGSPAQVDGASFTSAQLGLALSYVPAV